MRHLKISSLPKADTWVDRDFIMLHACFQILKDCVEKEKVDEHVNYEAHKDFVDEARFLYKWWEKRSATTFVETNEQEDEDQLMLIRLIKIRQSLWT